MIVNVPEKIRKKNEERGHPTQPYPVIQKDAALWSQQKTENDACSKKSDGIFFLESDARNYAEPQPVARLRALDGENGKVRAAHPEVGFEAVGAEQARVGKG